MTKFFSVGITVLISIFLILLFTGLLLVTTATCKLRWQKTYYVITPEKIMVVDGVWGKRQRSNNIKGMVGMQLQQNWIGKILGYGTITVKFMGGGEMNIRNIDEPEKHMEYIQDMLANGYVDTSLS